jgi:hypothetical protein
MDTMNPCDQLGGQEPGEDAEIAGDIEKALAG